MDRFSRAAGAGGLLFVMVMLVDSALRVGSPGAATSTQELAAWYGSRRLVPVAAGLGVVEIPCLLLFVAGLYRRLRDEGWALLGAIGIVVMAVLFAAAQAVDVVLSANAARLATSGALGPTLWSLKSALFSFAAVAQATGLGAMGMACRAAAHGPRGLANAAVAAGVVGILGGVPVRAVLEDSPVVLLQVAAFVCWLVFVVLHAQLLLREQLRDDRNTDVIPM